MTSANTFLTRTQPIIDAMPEGSDKEKLLALVTLQDTTERDDVHPKERARALQKLRQMDAPSRPPGSTP